MTKVVTRARESIANDPRVNMLKMDRAEDEPQLTALQADGPLSHEEGKIRVE